MRSSRKQAFYDNFVFEVFGDAYEPAEDTWLMADCLTQVVNKTDTVLDMGTGCGILAIVAAKKAMKVVATDINPHSFECARLNTITNGVSGKVDVRLGDLFKPIRKTEKFDVIVFNAPYLPSEPSEEETWMGRAWAGGPSGRQLIERFIVEAPRYLKKNGRILLVQSSLANITETVREFFEAGLEATVIAEKKISFETIVVVQAKAFIPRTQ